MLRLITGFLLLCIIFFPKDVMASAFIRDKLLIYDNYKEFSGGIFENTELNDDRYGFIRLSPKGSKFCPKGIYISPLIKTEFPAEEIYPSWNIICPKEKAGFRIYLRVSNDKINWSSWFYMGSWGTYEEDKKKVIKDDLGAVDIDFLSLKKGITCIQYSIHLFSSKDGHITPRVKLFAIAYGQKDKHALNLNRGNILLKKYLEVPYRSQADEDPCIAGRICSPTSVAMVMAYWGLNIPTAEIASMSYDKEHDIYGSWPLAVHVASQYGLKGWVQIFSSWSQVEEKISTGIPVIATISYKEGELKGSITNSSEGHVIVITGFDSEGNLLCNDPAGKNAKIGIMTYNKNDLEKVWFENSGIGYIILK
ncbi:MAG TPA: C39 family peptidase [Candidatus Eremiobacteraeota bacterium]|nr:MAG: hypothetical protein BWY64_00460 [bacterium ADurb.Bin363]HPZ07815.1 C39 family peptidase [Candidatus Eremiobacteraeota bacterium]